MSDDVIRYNKITVGFVTQNFKKDDEGNFVCTGQDFTCGDDVTIVDENGDRVDDFKGEEVYQPYDMVQPNPAPIKIIMIIEGGVIEGGDIPSNVRVEVRDYDTEGCTEDEEIKKDVDGTEYREIIFE